MKSESILDAAFSGFRFVRERPRTVAVWASVQLVFALALGVFMAWTAGPALMRLRALSTRGASDPHAALTSLAQLAPIYAALMAALVLFYAVFLAAVNRSLARPEESQFGYLRVGPDELRQFVLIVALVLVTAGLYVGTAIVAGVIFFALNLVVGHNGGVFAGLVTALIGLLTILLVMAGLIYFWVRLSLASPLTFATGRINVFGSWALTRGRFWSILGVFVLVFIMMIGVYLAGLTLIFAIAGAMGGASGIASVFRPDLSSIGAYLTPARIVKIVLQAGLSALVLPVMLCPAVDIYRRIAGTSDMAAVFS